MNIKSLISFVTVFTSVVSGWVIITPNSDEVPDDLLHYFNCPLGEINCKNSQKSSCIYHSQVCVNGNPLILGELLKKEGYNIGNLTPKKFCQIFLDACEMIPSYEPFFTEDYVTDLKRYDCDKSDSICRFDKLSSCKMALTYCRRLYNDERCDKLSDKCDEVNGSPIKCNTGGQPCGGLKYNTSADCCTKGYFCNPLNNLYHECQKCAGPNEPCGGNKYQTSPPCCQEGYYCKEWNLNYHQCLPIEKKCAGPYEACGGSAFKDAPTCCSSGYKCKKYNSYYSQCVPK